MKVLCERLPMYRIAVSVPFFVGLALLQSALPSKAAQPLPEAVYKAQCPVPSRNGPLFLGQGIPTLDIDDHIDIARDIHWLSVNRGADLVGYAVTGASGNIVLVPYTNRRVFKQQPKIRAASDYIPIGRFRLATDALTAVLRRTRMLADPSDRIVVHRCFRNVWDGKYPPGS